MNQSAEAAGAESSATIDGGSGPERPGNLDNNQADGDERNDAQSTGASTGSTLPPAPLRAPWLALMLLAPAPTIGVVANLMFPGNPWAMAAWAVSKAWLFLFPAVWTVVVDRQRLKLPRMTSDGLAAGLVTGLVILAGIVGGYFAVASAIDTEAARAGAAELKLDNQLAFLLLFVYIITVNSLLEEYVWRWFVVRQSEAALSPKWSGRSLSVGAACLSASLFTVHHIFAIHKWVSGDHAWLLITIASLGVFVGGATWSYLFARYRSIWPGYVSHVGADIAIMIIGWKLLMT